VTFDIPPDSHTAKAAVGAALAGLDLASARVNLDASKAAVNAMRANGELPVHPPRKTGRELRSASARQLNYPQGAAPLKHNLPLSAGPNACEDAARPRRAAPSRSISMPFVMQGRTGMQARLAATLAHDGAFQQQLQLLQGANGGAPMAPQPLQTMNGFHNTSPPTNVGMPTLANVSGGMGHHHQMAGGVSLDDSVLLGRPGGMGHQWASTLAQQQHHQHLQQQLQQQQQLQRQQLFVAQQQQQQQQQMAVEAQLARMQAQLAAQQQQMAASAGSSMDLIWAAGQSLSLPNMGRVASPPGLTTTGIDPAALLESYGNSSWQLLALTHANGSSAPNASRLAQELVLLAAACSGFGALGTTDPAHVAADFALVAAAAQRHLSLHHLAGGLSTPSVLAVRVLAAFAGPLCYPPGSAQPNAGVCDSELGLIKPSILLCITACSAVAHHHA